MDKAEMIKEIVRLQRRIGQTVRHNTPDAWMELNLTIPQLKSLFFIANQDGTNFTKLAAALRVTAANVTGIVDRLVEQGLVSREENPEDRRMLMLRVTDKGKSILDDLRERTAGQMSEILTHLTEEELSTIVKGFELLAIAAERNKEKRGDEHN